MVVSLFRTGLPGIALGAISLVGCAGPRPEVAVGLDRAGLAAYYQKEAQEELTPVTRHELFDGGPAIKAEMLRLVDLARDYILVDSFLVTDGPESREVLDALAKKAKEGVRVQVIGDSSSRFVPELQGFNYLNDRGVPAAEFHPIRGWRVFLLPNLFERDHRKFWVVDGRWVFLGGANVNDPSLMAPGQGGNRDLMMTLESRAAARRLTGSFVKTWNQSDGPGKLDEADFVTGEGRAESTAGEGTSFWFFDQDDIRIRPTKTEVMMEGLFASARRTVWLVEPYTFVNPRILSSIRSMTDRGVQVNVLLSSQARAPRFRYASFYGIKDLIESGAKVWIFDSAASPLHYKCALIDDELAYAGSSNLNLRSYRLSRELNVVFDHPGSVAEIRAVIHSVLKDCRIPTREEAKHYRTLPFLTWWLIMQGAG